jgi:tyrosyl-tRNA synthetase
LLEKDQKDTVMTAKTDQRLELASRGTVEILQISELQQLLEQKNNPRAYWGFECSGMMHLGFGLVCGDKIGQMLDAGFEFIVFLADWHSVINNKLGGDMRKIRKAGEYFKHCFTALGLTKERGRLEYKWASELAGNPDYWERVIRVGKSTTAQRVMRALPIMGRELKTIDTEAASLFYPCMQVADIFQMRLDVACAGIDQRKAHVLAREVGERLAWGKPICIHTPLLMGLAGMTAVEAGSYDEDPKISQVIAAKMSKSKPENNILVHDPPEQIADKLRRAYCPPKLVDGNPILQYYKLLIFPVFKEVVIERSKNYGGNLEFHVYSELEASYREGRIHPQDLKSNMARLLADRLLPVREYFQKHPVPLEEMRKIEASTKQKNP